MDLKLGRRNYLEGVHSPYKVLLRTVKCSATTAKDFGIRVAGMKVFRAGADNYIVRQKAWGNQLKRKDLHKAIHMYLHDGVRTRVDVIPRLINRLKTLVSALEDQTTFSFIASSVLLIYEGDTSDEVEQHVDVRLIDFDHTLTHDDGTAQDIAGVIFGVRSLIRLLKKLLYREQMCRSETDIFSFRAHLVGGALDGGETVSATEPAIFSEKHLPYRPQKKSRISYESNESEESSSLPHFSQTIEPELTNLGSLSLPRSQPMEISTTTTTTTVAVATSRTPNQQRKKRN